MRLVKTVKRIVLLNSLNTWRELKPTIFAGYNSAFFDFPFIIRRAEILGIDISEDTYKVFTRSRYERKGQVC